MPLRRPPVVERQPAIVPGVSWYITERDQLPLSLRIPSRPQRRPYRYRSVARCVPDGAEMPSSGVELPTGLRSQPAIPAAYALTMIMFMGHNLPMATIRPNDALFCVASDMRHASAAAPTRGDAAVPKIGPPAPYRHSVVQLGT